MGYERYGLRGFNCRDQGQAVTALYQTHARAEALPIKKLIILWYYIVSLNAISYVILVAALSNLGIIVHSIIRWVAVQNIRNPPVTFWQRQPEIGDLRCTTLCHYCSLAICSVMTWTCQQGSPFLNVVHLFWKIWIIDVWLVQKNSGLKAPMVAQNPPQITNTDRRIWM